jgi:hypothetical protein
MVTGAAGAARSGAELSANEMAIAFKQCIANPLSSVDPAFIDPGLVAPASWKSALIGRAFWIKLAAYQPFSWG